MVSGRPLEPGDTYYASLIELDEQDPPKQGGGAAAALGLKRLDISDEAWTSGFRPPNLFCHWKSTVPEPNKKKRLFVDDAVLMNLLRRLEDTDDPDRIAFRFVLALILMRKKLVRYDRTVNRTSTVDGDQIIEHWWQLVPKLDLAKGPLGKWNEQETIEVLDPKLDQSQVERVTTQLGEILDAEL